jgi:hypothetical protein
VKSRRVPVRGLPLGCAFLPAILIALLLGGTAVWHALRPASSALGEVMPDEAALMALRASTDAGLDSRFVIVELRRESTWLAEVRKQYRFRPVSRESALVWSISRDAPGWTQPLGDTAVCPPTHQWSREQLYGWDDVVLVDCPRVGRAFLLASNID